MERFSAPSPDRRVQSTIPESATLAQFLESPRLFRPKPEYINATFFVDDDTVLTHAIKIQNVAAVEVLLRGGADANAPSKKGIAPISGAAHKGNTAIMQLLIANGAQVNSMNSTGSTALIQASHFGHLEAVKLLLYHNATADFSNQKGTTALMRASQEGHVDISKCLIESGVDVNKKNHEGMNALMLASQRGHASIVYVLVKAGAAMDEQTAQGSTALMLACKRGHEKCAEVLVSMGAEIYMRDRRMRTAKDTATRRNHHALLCWLDTQMQVMRIQEGRHRQRIAMLSDLRTAHLQGRLRFNGSMEGLGMLYGVVQRLVLKTSAAGSSNTAGGASPSSDERLVAEFSRNAHTFAVSATRQPQDTLAAMQRSVLNEANCNAAISSQPVFRSSTRMAPRHEGFSDWQWPFLMNRCMALPSGIFELVMEYMPLPRVWQWSLLRLKRRCKLAPQQAVQDLSVIMDEILCDSAIFAGADQKNLLMKINRSPQVHGFLLEQLDMPESLLETLCSYADTQSLLLRTTELEVSFKPHFARNMLTAAVELYRWHRNHTSALKLLALQPYTPASSAGGLPGLRGAGHARKGSGTEGDDIEDADMETTDIAGEEEEEGQEDGEEEVSDFEGEFAQAEPDTENEMVVDDGGQILDDSDSEAEHNPQAGNVNIFAVGL